jgi:hypothetical protein
MERVIETSTHPATAISTAGSVVAANVAGFGVSDYINWATAVYITILIVHKIMSMVKPKRGVDDNTTE